MEMVFVFNEKILRFVVRVTMKENISPSSQFPDDNNSCYTCESSLELKTLASSAQMTTRSVACDGEMWFTIINTNFQRKSIDDCLSEHPTAIFQQRWQIPRAQFSILNTGSWNRLGWEYLELKAITPHTWNKWSRTWSKRNKNSSQRNFIVDLYVSSSCFAFRYVNSTA